MKKLKEMIFDKSFLLFWSIGMVVTFLITIFLELNSPVDWEVFFSSNNVIKFLLISVFILLSSIFWIKYSEIKLPRDHRVAIIGFPKSGKTTLIISLFGEIFSRSINNVKAILLGDSTIDRVNDGLKILEKGKALGPTKDQDIFSFRSRIEIPRVGISRIFLNSKVYKLEFGDFPGEDSEEYVDYYGEHLHTTPFFKWATNSDALVFVVDIGKYLFDKYSQEENGFVPTMSSAIRSSWQHLLEAHFGKEDELKMRPVILLFSKSDLFNIKFSKEFDDSLIEHMLETNKKHNESEVYSWNFLEKISKLGFDTKVPPIVKIDDLALEEGKKLILNDFQNIINYLESEVFDFSILFTSSFGIQENKRLGLSELIKMVLPK